MVAKESVMASGRGRGGGRGKSRGDSLAQVEVEVGLSGQQQSHSEEGTWTGVVGCLGGRDVRIIGKTRGRRAGEQPLVYGTSRRAGGEEPLYAYITSRDPPQMRWCNGNTWKEKIKFPYRTPLYEN